MKFREALMISVMLKTIQAAQVGGVCDTNVDCDVANSSCQRLFTNCLHGECVCEADHVHDGGVCKSLVSFNATCDNSTVCANTTTCQKGRCTCDEGLTYHPVIHSCVPGNKNLIGEECGSDIDCYAGIAVFLHYGGVMCSPRQHETSQKVCSCLRHTDGYGCRYPALYEPCDADTNPCRSQFRMDDYMTNSGQVHETCQQGRCECPPNSTKRYKVIDNRSFTYCQYKQFKNLLGDGELCYESMKCRSNICAQCPGKTFSICARVPGDTSTASRRELYSYSTTVVLVTVLSILY